MDVVGEISSESGGEGIEIVMLSGEHDLGTMPMVRNAFDAATGNGSALMVDISKATFIDSSILGAVLEARRQAAESDRGFGVACEDAAEPVRRVLEVTGLAEELPVHTSRAAALQALAAAPT